MLEIIFLICLALIWIIFASIQDLKQREVANWLNFSLIIFAIGFRFYYSLFNANSFAFFYQGLIGFGIFFILGNLFYYGRMFAGGDAKLMISLGAILPLSSEISVNIKIFTSFLILFLAVGAFYGLFWSMIMGIKNFKKLKKEFSKKLKQNKKSTYSTMILGLVLIFIGFFENLFFPLGILIFLLPNFYLYAKAVDESCMIKKLKVNELREGDWLCQDLKIGRKIIKKSWDGLTKEQIKLIKKKFKKIEIKQGIPFVPVFLISFLILIYLFYFKKLEFFYFLF